jgi:hypothetical protein
MNKQLHEEIEVLKKAIKAEEEKVALAAQRSDDAAVSKSLAAIDSDLKYLSIVVNGAPIDKREGRNIQEFLRVHFENLCKFSLPN